MTEVQHAATKVVRRVPAILDAKPFRGRWHELHESDGTRARYRLRVVSRLGSNDGVYQMPVQAIPRCHPVDEVVEFRGLRSTTRRNRVASIFPAFPRSNDYPITLVEFAIGKMRLAALVDILEDVGRCLTRDQYCAERNQWHQERRIEQSKDV